MELYLHQDGEQVGPYSEEQISSMLTSGALTRDDLVWHEGLTEWQPLHAIFSLPAPIAPPAPARQAIRQPTSEPLTIMTNVKQGAIIGGWVCFGLGILCMLWSLVLFFLYGPFFLVAFILSIVAMSQRRVMGGIALLVATLLVPTILGAVLFTTRATKFADDLSKSLETSRTSKHAMHRDGEIVGEESKTFDTSNTGNPSPTESPPSKNAELDSKMGFRTFKLGTAIRAFNPDDLEAGRALYKTDNKAYFAKNFDAKLGAAEIDSIQLNFNEDILQSVIVQVKGEQNEIALRETLIAGYGQPDETTNIYNRIMRWEGDDCILILTADTLKGTNARFSSKSVDETIKEIKLKKARQEADAGVGEL